MGGLAVAGQTMYCYATHPCSHVALSGSKKNELKKGRESEKPSSECMCAEIGSSSMRMSMCQMIFGRVMFCVVVSKIVTAFVPEDAELFLGFAAFEPVDAHFK